jgi:methionyl-tRNA formyltransferase
MMRRFRIVFMGTPEFACPTLRMLLERGEEVVAVVTREDKPSGRGQKLTPPPVKVLAQEHGVPVLQPQKVRTPEFLDAIRALEPDLAVVIAYGKILPQALLDIPKFGSINIHASLLPRWRGAAPINWSIVAGDAETGVTTMMMDAGLDTGDMLVKRSTRIDPDEDSSSLHDRLCVIGAEAMDETLDLLARENLAREKQDDALMTYAPMLKKEDGLIDWSKGAEEIKNLVRGLSPWPGAYSFIAGEYVKICRVRTTAGTGVPGTVISADKEGIDIACGVGTVVIEELQLQGRKRLAARDFLAGFRLGPGTVLGKESA